ncbi:hypothetical protein C1637_05600 [Chryseobacterium lactis]|uniref:Polyisoprenoid-binding protein n=1 Tax=Chryseobacterium lactis TaxID=1241981 RepID=A0A3G6RLE1_CHRLC|nr:YceI family protein [Chryseobacterium lactis]AZA84315.1 polyisoprenoid-binding protein [Chryseobacterium lactis]AZB04703.1 polyisoprenoid-binding protein [Chryseobacterium lactis]PNW14434.1 hypothetical protein C1637_05600 [Chryseobacterium lactis]
METTTATLTKWIIDPMHSQIGFKVKHLMFTNVRGIFDEYDANIHTVGNDFTTVRINVRINTASINTSDERRDEHLRSADFFDVENFSEMTFTSTSYEKTKKNGNYSLFGDLTIKGITKRIRLEMESGGIIKDPWGNEKAVFNITGRISRRDWGLNWNAALEAGGVLVSEDVWINCEVQLTRDTETK